MYRCKILIDLGNWHDYFFLPLDEVVCYDNLLHRPFFFLLHSLLEDCLINNIPTSPPSIQKLAISLEEEFCDYLSLLLTLDNPLPETFKDDVMDEMRDIFNASFFNYWDELHDDLTFDGKIKFLKYASKIDCSFTIKETEQYIKESDKQIQQLKEQLDHFYKFLAKINPLQWQKSIVFPEIYLDSNSS